MNDQKFLVQKIFLGFFKNHIIWRFSVNCPSILGEFRGNSEILNSHLSCQTLQLSIGKFATFCPLVGFLTHDIADACKHNFCFMFLFSLSLVCLGQ